MPQAIVSIASKYMHLPLRVEVARAGTTADRVDQEVIFVDKADKPRLLDQVLDDVKGSVLVFSRTKFGARRIARSVKHTGHAAADIHSDRSLSQRKDALEGFKTGRYRVLVATDIAARGIDVTGIELVVNYDLPSTAEDYVHRIGRTGRAGLPGRAISFATPDQQSDIRAIERLIRTPLPAKRASGLPPARPRPDGPEHEPRRPFPPRRFHDARPPVRDGQPRSSFGQHPRRFPSRRPDQRPRRGGPSRGHNPYARYADKVV
ncbi:MAG: DEAD/DEAH box helicase [Candidatus Kerfeldbacteria bacterium]|nr:DEAD/DEAH box helicase [Candidatus Kerfeldbacteria bacterium]